MLENELLGNLINDLIAIWSSQKDSYGDKAHCLRMHLCVRIYIYIIHACLYMFLKVGTENY